MKNIPLYDVRPISNLKEMLESSTVLFGDKPAFWVKKGDSSEYSPISYKQFKSDVDSLGTALCDLGLQGKRIAIIGENRYEWAVSYLAIVNGTGVVVPLDKELPENEIASLLTRAKVSAIIYTDKVENQIKNISKYINFVNYYINMDTSKDNNVLSFSHLIEKGRKLITEGNNNFIKAKINNDEMSILLFTSATTDISKAVMLSHTNICSNLMAMSSMVYIDNNDIFLSILPIHHAYECTCGFLCPIYRGSSIAYFEGLRHIVKNLKESKATIVLGVPLIFESMYKKIIDQVSKKPNGLLKLKTAIKINNLLKIFKIDLSKKFFAPVHENLGGNIRLFISGAAAIDPAVSKGFRDLGINFLQGYGLTECSPIVALNRDVDFKDDAAGIALTNLKVVIENKNSEDIGEIIVKGPSVMLGYYENEEANQEAFSNGWFKTGDLGYIDKDHFIHITGRKKNVIVTKNGKNIFPEEIETLLNMNNYIKESMVFGKKDKDSDDAIIAAAIVPDMEKIAEDFNDKEISKEFIYDLVKSHVKEVNNNLVSYKHIKEIEIREKEFEKTTTKKIKRYMEIRD